MLKTIVRSLKHSKFISSYKPRYFFSKVENELAGNEAMIKKLQERFQVTEGLQYMNTPLNDGILNNYGQKELTSHFDKSGEKSIEKIQERLKKNINERVSIIQEGKAQIFHKEHNTDDTKKHENEQAVFYNPVQVSKSYISEITRQKVFNRDISLLVLESYAEFLREQQGTEFTGLKVLDALAGTGIRTARMAKEIDPSLLKFVHASDQSEDAVDLMVKNFELNQLDPSKVKAYQEDANYVMLNSGLVKLRHIDPTSKKYNVIDIDPYGSSLPFINLATKSIDEGGLICATFTDLKMLCEFPPAPKCFSTYGVTRAKVSAYQENALRAALYSISSIAGRSGLFIRPLLSFNSDFYQRIFFTVHSSRNEAAETISKYSNAYVCEECGNTHIQQLGKIDGKVAVLNKLNPEFLECGECGSEMKLNGPIWTDELNDKSFVKYMLDKVKSKNLNNLELKTEKNIYGLLHSILDEKELSQYPLSLNMDHLGKFFKCLVPNHHIFVPAFREHGYEIRPSYIYKNLWKTNAPNEFVYDFFRGWRRYKKNQQNQDFMQNIESGTPEYTCITQKSKYTFDFNKIQSQKIENPAPREEKVPRFFPNPEKNWGPKRKASSSSK